MNYFYLLVNLGSVIIPFLFSFHLKVRFYKYWNALFLATFLTMAIFIPWDIAFTEHGFWGFNERYLLGVNIFNLPIEEWLFFICIPYACVFTHYSLSYYFKNIKLSLKASKIIRYLFLIVLTILFIFNTDKWYTFVNFGYGIIIILIAGYFKPKLFQTYFLTFIVMLLPFFIVNGLLTGSWIEEQVVWYNNAENLGIRLGTIPVEDTVYAFTLMLTNLFLMEQFFLSKELKSD